MNYPDIYTFTCYREYLTQWYRYQKENHPQFSYRSFAEELPQVSYNYLHRIINGSRSLAVKLIPDFTSALALTQDESTYFDVMVRFANAKESREKTLLMKRLLILRSKYGKAKISEERLRFFEMWYRPIIRELASLNSSLTYSEMGKLCIPPLSAKEAKEAVKFLLDHNFLSKDETTGELSQVSPVISTGDEISSLFVRDYHAENLKITADLVHDIPPHEREISSLTFSVSENTYNKMKQEIQHFRKRLMKLAQEDDTPERVYQASFQLLPRSEKGGDRD